MGIRISDADLPVIACYCAGCVHRELVACYDEMDGGPGICGYELGREICWRAGMAKEWELQRNRCLRAVMGTAAEVLRRRGLRAADGDAKKKGNLRRGEDCGMDGWEVRG